ncbi:metallophosphoesterase [Leeuwenhoekiella parthenopeia]|uniref:Metallophosphoesterase n=1 Tax=Leeuwenhoekiella parthenopeia TaxID=2890320 RepID=A0ABS8GT12_9FLAO|nr:metallophosphoesterase [Leeuwenhoekiella parthenopeia]MCC4213141.1 metallophosphoesterase [Leeuwenhoekiella parthenopeia]
MRSHLPYKSLIVLIVTGLFVSCASELTQFRDRDQKILKTTADTSAYRSFFVLGNLGAHKKGPNNELLKAFYELQNSNASQSDYLVLAGDNIYPDVGKKEDTKEQLDPLVKLIREFKGKTLIIPGEHEWNDRGVNGLENIEDLIEEKMGKDNHFQPENGCPIEVIDVDDETEIIIADSQWYIEDWSKHPGFNDKCAIKTRVQFLTLLKDEARKARHKNVILVMHHPLYSNGIYGGEMSTRALYRPSAENAFIPGVGFLWAFARTQGGISKQDQFNPLMNDLMQEIKQMSIGLPRLFVLSAHEQSLQYIENEDIRQIISGTAAKSEYARLGKDGIFASVQPGLAELRLYKDGASSVHFYELNQTSKLVERFSKESFAAPEPYPVNSLPNTFPKTETASIYPKDLVEVSEAYEEKWGKHYRDLYGLEIEAPVAILDTLYGGLKVERAGGGHQTQSLRLVDADDREYNMRALAKDPFAFLQAKGYNDLDAQQYFKGTLPARLIEDFYTASHPYGAFAIPRLAGAADLNHTHPKVYYVPKQEALGDFNDTHGDRLYMIVEKPDDDFNGSHMFGFNEDVESTADLFEAIREDEKNQVDEQAYIKARVFDMLVGDWDRHEDQWRWAERKNDDSTYSYIAIPRDRDQVFSKFDGKIIKKLQKFMAGTRELGNYGPDIEYVKHFSESAINLDRALLQHTNKKDWLDAVDFIQKNITPEVVAKAFSEMPKEIQDENWKQLQSDVLARKENLISIVERYYDYYIDFQTLKGTDKDDHFYIDRNDDGTTRISAYRIKDGEDGSLLFDRVFAPKETQEIWVYGLDDEDVFTVTGKKGSKIKMVIAGGQDDDTYEIENGSNLTVYDQPEGNIVKENKGARLRFNSIYENHIYDSERRPDEAKKVALKLPYNPDWGVAPHIRIARQKMGFERNPFTSQFVVDAQYFSLTQAAAFEGELHFSNIFSEWNFLISTRVTTNNYTENFFGFGNESVNNASNFDANRLLNQQFEYAAGVYYNGEYGSSFKAALAYQHYAFDPSALREPGNATSQNKYATLKTEYNYRSVDDAAYPTRGMHFKAAGSIYDNLNDATTVYAADPSITFWNAIDSSRDLVLKTEVAGQLRFGDPAVFFQSARLGASSGLRSYRLDRFAGDKALRGSADVLYQFTPLKTALFPVRTHIFGGYDLGRVWYDGENSERWHDSYGGGIHFAMGGFISGNLAYFTGDEGGRLSFGFNFGL